MSLICHFLQSPHFGGKENIRYKQGSLETNLAANGAILLTIITLFNPVIHHNDKVKPKKFSSFTLKKKKKTAQKMSRLPEK